MSARRTPRAGAGLLLLALTVSPLRADDTKPAADAPATPEALPAVAAGPVSTYSYNADGRRDPFVSLVGRGMARGVIPRGEGLQALTAAEISVRGVLQSRGGYVAIVQGPDQKTHIVRPNDRLADGTVKTITPEGLVILQEVTDPLSLVKHKEVRKGLPGSEGN